LVVITSATSVFSWRTSLHKVSSCWCKVNVSYEPLLIALLQLCRKMCDFVISKDLVQGLEFRGRECDYLPFVASINEENKYGRHRL